MGLPRVKKYEKPADDVVFCANCAHAKRVIRKHWKTRIPVEQVTCKMGLWAKHSNGKGAYVDYYYVHARTRKDCPAYNSMSDDPGDLSEFLDSLPQSRLDYEMSIL